MSGTAATTGGSGGPEPGRGSGSGWPRRLLRLLRLPAAGYATFLVLAFIGQRHVLFPGQHMEPFGSGEPVRDGTEIVRLQTGGETVEAWYVPPPAGAGLDAPAPALLFTHGNAEMIDYWEDEAWNLREMGVAVLLVEYPGYGRSGGRPSQATVTGAVVAGFDFLAGREGVDADRIVAMGRSVGGGPASALTRERPVAALVLQSTFTDIPSLARRLLFPPFLVRDRFDSRAAVAAFDGPVLVFHGRNDDMIPFEHGRALADAAGDGRLVPMECVHDDCPPDADAFRAELRGFLEESRILERRGPSP